MAVHTQPEARSAVGVTLSLKQVTVEGARTGVKG
jgi:hypothetical protein